MGKNPQIILDQVSYRYPGARSYAIKKLSLSIDRGEVLAVLGENGAGKSTLCQLLNGVIPHSRGGRLRGRILVDGIDTRQASVASLAQKVGIVLDDPESQLFTTSVLHEVAFGPENLGLDREEIVRRAHWAIDVVGLAGLEDHSPGDLSGGQKQRLSIAAALAMMPDVLVLDEATSQLDPMGTLAILSLVQELNRQHGMTIVMVTDRGEEVSGFCDRVVVLHEGECIAQDTPRHIFADQGLLSTIMIRTPQVSQLAAFLEDQGRLLPSFPITVDEACQGIELLFNGEQGA